MFYVHDFTSPFVSSCFNLSLSHSHLPVPVSAEEASSLDMAESLSGRVELYNTHLKWENIFPKAGKPYAIFRTAFGRRSDCCRSRMVKARLLDMIGKLICIYCILYIYCIYYMRYVFFCVSFYRTSEWWCVTWKFFWRLHKQFCRQVQEMGRYRTVGALLVGWRGGYIKRPSYIQTSSTANCGLTVKCLLRSLAWKVSWLICSMRTSPWTLWLGHVLLMR